MSNDLLYVIFIKNINIYLYYFKEYTIKTTLSIRKM